MIDDLVLLIHNEQFTIYLNPSNGNLHIHHGVGEDEDVMTTQVEVFATMIRNVWKGNF